MTRWDLVDVARSELHLRSVFHADAQAARDEMALVMRLAAVRARYRFDVLRPAPTRLEPAAGDGEIAKPHDVERPMRKVPGLVGSSHVLPLQRRHDQSSCRAVPHNYSRIPHSISTSSQRTSP